MIPVLFKEDEQVFTHNGIGALYESLSCDVIEEENGAFTMELEYPVDGEWFSELKDFRIIQAKPNDIDEPHNFRIYEIEKSIDELTVFVRANTRTNDLGNNLITNYIGKNVTPQQAMNGIKNNLIEGTNFDLISDIQTKSSVEWTRINPLNAIVGVRGSLVDIWGGQLKRTNTAIHLYSRRGRDNVVTIRPGKNIEGLNMTVSTAGLVTKILPTFSYRPIDVPKYQMVTRSDGSKEKRRVPTSGGTTLRDDITVLGDVVSSQYVDNYPTNYWSSVDYGDDDELKDKVDNYIETRLTAAEDSPTILDMSKFENDLKNFVKTELDKRAKQYFTHRNPGVDKPTVRISVNMIQLSDSPDWEEFKDLEQIGLTDTLDVWVEEYDIDVEVRVTSLTYDSIGEEVTTFSAGSDRAPRQSAIEKKYDDLTKATNDYITSFKNGVQNVMRNTADGLNRKFEGYTEPPAELSSEGDIWFKEIGEGKVEIWIHDGVYWQPLMTEDFVEQLVMDIAATQEELEEAKQQAKSDTDQALEDAMAHAEAEDARIRGELESEVDGAIALAQQAKADAVTKANQALADAKTYADEEIVLIETHFDGIIESVESDVAVAKQTADSALHKINNDIADKFDSLDIEVLAIETISNSAQVNAQTALNQSLDALGDASTALTNAQTALNRANDVHDTADILSGKVSGFETTMAGFNQTVNNYAGQVSGFRNDILGLESTVASYEIELDEFGNTVSTYATEVSTLTNTVSGFQSKVTKVEQDYAGISGTVATHTSQISNIDGQIALKANTTTVNTLTGRVSTAETGITANADAIKLKANTTTVNTLTGRVSTAESSITANADAIALKANTTTVNTLTGRVTTAETGITANANAIKLKASTTSVNTLTGRVSTAESSITANATAISQRLTTTQVNTLVDGKGYAKEASVTTRINDIQSTVDGTNQTIATLRTDVNGKATITQFNTLTSTVNGTVTRVGNAEGKITTIETNVSGLQTTVASKASQSQVTQLATGLSSVVTDLSNLEIGGRNLLKNSDTRHSNTGYPIAIYTLTEPIPDNSEVTISIKATLGRDRFGIYNSGGSVSPTSLYPADKKNGVFRKTFRWRVGTSSNTTVNVYPMPNGTGTATTIEWIKLEYGNKATDWTPAPEDTQSQITQNANNINLRVTKGDVINQINVSSEGILIDGKRIHITGTTTIDNGVIKNAHIGDLNATKITAGTISTARLNTSAIVTAGLTANVIKSTHIETSTATVNKIFATDAMVNTLTAKTAFITSVKAVNIDAARITSGTISAARLNASAIVTAGLTANVVKSTHISADTALFDMLFSTSSATDRLSARTAWIKNANIADATINGAKIVNATISSAKISALDVSKISGNTSNFVQTNWNSAAGGAVTITGGGVSTIDSEGYITMLQNGVLYVKDGTRGLGTVGGATDGARNTFSIDVINPNQFMIREIFADGRKNEIFSFKTYLNRFSMYKDLHLSEKLTVMKDVDVNQSTIYNSLRITFGSSNSVINSIYHSSGYQRYVAPTGFRWDLSGYQVFVMSRSGSTNNASMYAHLNMQGYNITGQSDERLKTNIFDHKESSLDKINQFNFVDFEWIKDGRNDFGVIAQQVQQVAPELILESEDGYLNLNNSLLSMMTTHALQELSLRELNTNKVASQALQLGESNKSEIDELREENKDLRNRIEELESVV